MSTVPWLMLAVGNPARGDDALAPMLLERLAARGIAAGGEVELLTDFQLQVEHALDLRGRCGVLFVDAALPGTVRGAALSSLTPDPARTMATHAMHPAAVLHVAEHLDGHVPAAWLLAIEGASFGLGEPPSGAGLDHLAQAEALALQWLHARRAARTGRRATAPQPLPLTSTALPDDEPTRTTRRAR